MTREQLQADIASIEPGSIAEELGLLPGDLVLRVNGEMMLDVLDYQQHVASDRVRLEVWRRGEVWECDIEKDEEEALGIVFSNVVFDGVRRCRNRCTFCFVDNLPEGLRPSLYVKDDDYRLSLLHGNFITLTNLTESDWQRIFRLRLSPLHVSVHATDPTVRSQMMGCRRAGQILRDLTRLVDGGIEVHAQIVVCPGVNDGEVLDETVRDLAELHPGVASVGVVPVGLTRFAPKHRNVLPVGPPEARRALAQVHVLQDELLDRLGTRFVFAADELYLRADRAPPSAEECEGWPQLSNGVGLITSFHDDEAEALEAAAMGSPTHRRITVITGVDAEPTLAAFCERLSGLAGVEVMVLTVGNEFFGDSVTVAGLMVGQDICRALRNVDPGELVLVPEVALKDRHAFLDDLTIEDLVHCTRADVRAVPATPMGIVEAVARSAP